MSEFDDNKKMGKAMMWIAWGLFFVLMFWFFQGVLQKQHNPNQQPQMNLTQDGRSEVTLERNRFGHYLTNGSINGSDVVFLLDTGATNVSIPASLADNLNLPIMGYHYVQTANGSVQVQQTEIAELSIGNIILYNVAANINPGMKTNEILLGMSALKQLDFSQSGKYLTLTQ
ncbi:retropepsin-like aspartic protease [Thalassotalea ponticola]|uniref:retropepsin-like aspartic protease family protein n=1 Tax=Thalassotalea ponticola TaxID=1523392 RepID=UPI0025B5BD65|nr:retropepsin-like aspartic protease [Thalassotalea ponticola]MDN3653584.1 retropepsin-like aspartic protease [Thalassotalea ponticola]